MALADRPEGVARAVAGSVKLAVLDMNLPDIQGGDALPQTCAGAADSYLSPPTAATPTGATNRRRLIAAQPYDLTELVQQVLSRY